MYNMLSMFSASNQNSMFDEALKSAWKTFLTGAPT